MLLGGLIFGGYTLYRQGTFRYGVGPAVSQVLSKMPYFGSRFRHYRSYGKKSFSRSEGRAYKRSGKARSSQRKYRKSRSRRRR